ncbi:MAG TPA: amino acid--[acyl-carrier-protein] ligase [Xanthobacteraceae bacterium]|jgi:seryl-tRNA synthetase|nr:amino acid--[acyl-carrier-protein] ligase [Xanthobacteraceae bacterium]
MNFVIRDPAELTPRALFQSSGVDGVCARTQLFERAVEGLTGLISRLRPSEAEVLRFPPVTNRAHIEKSGYLHSFPHLLGAVCCLHGGEGEIRAAISSAGAKEWVAATKPTDLVLTPAACYPLYPLVAARGPIAACGFVFDVASDCFRHEPSQDIDRFQSFRMREFVCMGAPGEVTKFREEWMVRGREFAELLDLPHAIESASDPFFGRAGKLLAMSQIEQAAKFELLIPVRSGEQPTACMSFNYHRDHFGTKWGLRTEDGEVAHTACTAFGIDRLALALFSAHGLDLARWPARTREALSL